jgi:hypothetical protein
MNRFPCGSVPEIIVEGETDFLVEDIADRLIGGRAGGIVVGR